MSRKLKRAVSYFLSLGFTVLLIVWGGTASNEGEVIGRAAAPPETTCKLYARRPGVEITKRISLRLTGCTFREPANFPVIGFTASALAVEGDAVTLTSPDGTTKRGEVIAYAMSVYCLNANVGMIFDRSSLPSSDKDWKPPKIISLNLVQQSSKNFRLFSAPGVAEPFDVNFTCEAADGDPVTR